MAKRSPAVRIEVTYEDDHMDVLEGPGTDDVWREMCNHVGEVGEEELPALKLMRHEQPVRQRTEVHGTPEQLAMFGYSIPEKFMPWLPTNGYRTIVVDIRVVPK